MFTKPPNEIEFSDIKEFCSEFGEGVRVEYKQEIKHIPKIVSSFANTLGGIFIIGAETDKQTNKVIAIDGIPNSGGLEEQIQQSALTGIYRAVMPDVIIIVIPNNPNNVVVVVRVDESLQAPHAIQNSTRIYIRTGSITQPYELAEIDRIEYMLKRREDSHSVSRQILKRIEERAESSFRIDDPNLTVIFRPVFPYRPVISGAEIYEYVREERSIPFNDSASEFGTRRVQGGVCFMGRIGRSFYWELNEYGMLYHRWALSRGPWQESNTSRNEDSSEEEYLTFGELARVIGEFVPLAQSFYQKCLYSGNIEIIAQLRQVCGEKLKYADRQHPEEIQRQESVESEILASTQCRPQDLVKAEKLISVVDELVGPLLWGFNIDNNRRREKVERILRQCELIPIPPQ